MNPFHSEQYLLQKTAEGDAKAFEMLYLTYRPELASFIFKLSRSSEVAEEIVQDVFLKLWNDREKLAAVNAFRNYLFVVARHHALNVLRKSVAEKNKFLSYQRLLTHNPEDQPDERDFYSELEEAVNRLPPQQKKVYILCRQEGMRPGAVAGHLGLSQHSVKKYLKLAVCSIKTYLTSKMERTDLNFAFLLFLLS